MTSENARRQADAIVRDAGLGQDCDAPYDPASPLAYLEKAAAAPEGERARLAVAAVAAMLAAGAGAGTVAVARDYVKRAGLLALASFDSLAREARGSEPSSVDVASAATLLVELAQERYTFGVSDTGEPFAVPNAGPRIVAMLRGGKTSLRALMAREYFTRTGRAAAQQALADALLVIEGMAQEAEESRLYLRAAQVGGTLWLDLGDTAGRAVKITAAGWSVEDSAPVLFKRTALTGPLPVPQPGGGLDALWGWLNVTEGDRPLVVAAQVAALFSEQPHVVLGIFGEQGTGKTTAAKVLAMLLDPGPVPVRKPPRDADSWVTAAAGSWVVALDNLSDIPPWLSDSLCRASTGDGDVRRKLYSDSDYAVFAFRRCIIFSAIDVGALAPDLADRALPLTLTLIDDEHRQDEETFWAAWHDAHPQLLGALLGLAAAVLRRLPDVTLPRKPRMADYGRILTAVDAELGTAAFSRYASQAADLAADSLAGDPLAGQMAKMLTSTFEGTSADLLQRVKPAEDELKKIKDWPGSAGAVTGKLRRLAPAFRKAGWTVDDLGRGGHGKQLRWRICAPEHPETSRQDARACPQRPQDDAEAGTAGRRGHDAGPSQDAPEEKTCGKCGGPLEPGRSILCVACHLGITASTSFRQPDPPEWPPDSVGAEASQ